MVSRIAESLRRPGREKGFTLIELVIVIAIIAILLAVAIPVYQTVTLKVAQKSHDTNLRSIDSAVLQYFVGEGEYPENIEALAGEKKYLEEIPDIPELVIKHLGLSEGVNYSLEGEDPPRAAPVGDWGGYRSEKSEGPGQDPSEAGAMRDSGAPAGP